MHSGNLSELGGASLTETEREALLDVMQRAKDFDEKMQRATNTKLEGTLSKWTNALKGWQSRWLCVDQQQGVLHYYTSEDRKKAPPRGSLHLWGAVIAPSDEDSQTFIVNGANGEAYKLRAGDAKERQYWVSRLRSEIERCTTSAQSSYSTNTTSSTSTNNTQVPSTSAQSNTTHTASNTIPSSPLSPLTSPTSSSTDKTLSQTTPTRRVSRSKGRGLSAFTARASKKQRKQHSRRSEQGTDQEDGLPGGEAMLELLTRLMEYQSSLTSQLESCGGVGVSPVDEEVLLLKATSEAAVHSVKDCLALIQLQQQTCSSSTTNGTSLNTAPTASLAEEEERKVSVDDAGPPPTPGSTAESAEEGSRHTPSSPSHSVTVTTV